MPVPRFEVPSGAVDGVNTVYTVSVPYKLGTTAVFLNGLLQEKSLDDGWTETDPLAGEVTLKEAPQGSGACPDVIQIFFIDTSPEVDSVERVRERLRGRLRAVGTLDGALRQEALLRVSLDSLGALEGRLVADPPLRGVVEGKEPLRGRLKAVC
jgi:hypothetical protein